MSFYIRQQNRQSLDDAVAGGIMIGIEKFEIEDGHVIFYLDSVGEEKERVRIRKKSDSVDFFSDHIFFREPDKRCVFLL